MESIGDILRRKREAMGLSLQQIEEETNMRWKYLEALEKGNYHIIPGEAYVKGFLRNYAAFLELNSEAIVKMYREQQGETKPEEETQKEESQKRAKSRRKEKESKPYLLIGVATLILAVTGVIYALSGDNTEDPGQTGQQEIPIPKEEPGDTKVEPTPSPEPSPAPTNEPEPPAQVPNPTPQNGGSQSLVLKAVDGRSWVRVEVDGSKIYEGHLSPGETKDFKGSTIKVRYGNAGAIRVNLNGEELGAPGPMGQPVNKDYGN